MDTTHCTIRSRKAVSCSGSNSCRRWHERRSVGCLEKQTCARLRSHTPPGLRVGSCVVGSEGLLPGFTCLGFFRVCIYAKANRHASNADNHSMLQCARLLSCTHNAGMHADHKKSVRVQHFECRFDWSVVVVAPRCWSNGSTTQSGIRC